MSHGVPRDPSDYQCHCSHCEPPDPERDWLQEALAIYHGTSRLLAQREHIVALVNRMVDGRAGMLAKFRAQAAGVANPVTREQLGESIDAAERVAK